MRYSTYKYSDKQGKWYIRCPYCKHVWTSNNKDVTCLKCNRKLQLSELDKRLHSLSRALSSSINDDMKG